MTVKVTATRKISANSAFGRELKMAGLAKIAAAAEAVGALAVEATNAIVSKEYVNDRPANRRKGGRHLLGSFRYQIIPATSANDVVVIKLVSYGTNPDKVNALNDGSPEHRIFAPLKFPRGVARGAVPAKHTPNPVRFRQGYGKQDIFIKKGYVEHPGTGAGHFMERGLERAVQAAYGGSVKIRRRRR